MVASKTAIEEDLQKLEKDFHMAERFNRHTAVPLTYPSRQIVRRKHEPYVQENWLGRLIPHTPTKAPFQGGDNVWTTMEQQSEQFVQNMRIWR
jgi:hypothetical protein